MHMGQGAVRESRNACASVRKRVKDNMGVCLREPRVSGTVTDSTGRETGRVQVAGLSSLLQTLPLQFSLRDLLLAIRILWALLDIMAAAATH